VCNFLKTRRWPGFLLKAERLFLQALVLALALSFTALLAAEAEQTDAPWAGIWVLSADPAQQQNDYLLLSADGKADSYTASGRHFEGSYEQLDDMIQTVFQIEGVRVGLLFRYLPDSDMLRMELGSGEQQRYALYWRTQALPEKFSD